MADVFYAIRTSLDDLKVAATLTISSNVATISVAQTGDIGQGWEIDYGATNKLAYISEFTSTTSFKLTNAAGGSVSDEVSAQTINSILPVWASLAAAEAAYTAASFLNTTDLVTNTLSPFFECYGQISGNTGDTSTLSVNGATKDASFFLTIRSPQGGTESANDQRHSGIWDDTKFKVEGSAVAIAMNDDFDEVIGLQYHHTNDVITSEPTFAIRENGTIDSCIVDCNKESGGIILSPGSGQTANLLNTLIYFLGTQGSVSEGVRMTGVGTANIDYCTVYNQNDGIERDSGTLNVTNTIVFDCVDDFDGTMTIVNCASNDGDGSNAVTLADGTYAYSNIWTDFANGDFSLVNNTTDTNAPQNKGTFTSGDVDILGIARNDPSDIGAFEFASGGPTIVEETITEGAEASDSITDIVLALESLTEGAISSDVTNEVAVAIESLTEGSLASDSNSETMLFIESLTEGILAGETNAEALVVFESILEGALASDENVESVVFFETVSEGAIASDANTDTFIFSINVVEGAVASDNESNLLLFIESITEGIIAGDFEGQVGDTFLGVIRIEATASKIEFKTQSRKITFEVTVNRPTFKTNKG